MWFDNFDSSAFSGEVIVPVEKTLVFIFPGFVPGSFHACDPVQGEQFQAAEKRRETQRVGG
jgi:hypothetical protein